MLKEEKLQPRKKFVASAKMIRIKVNFQPESFPAPGDQEPPPGFDNKLLHIFYRKL